MRKTALEFAQGTANTNKKLILGLFPKPAELLQMYRTARAASNTPDIVLCVSLHDPSDLRGGSRQEYCEHLRRVFGLRASNFAMWRRSAQSVVQSPPETEAFWLVIDNIPKQDMPSMTVMFAIPYEQAKEGEDLREDLAGAPS